MTELRVKVAVPAPFAHALDYLAGTLPILPGCRVLVPLGSRVVTGIALTSPEAVADDSLKCRPVSACLDSEPFLPPAILELCVWASGYYHFPLGQVFAAAIPAILRAKRAARKGPAPSVDPAPASRAPPVLTEEQQAAIDGLDHPEAGFKVSLIDGVTGSGKTEIYLQRTARALDRGGQVLVLVPEIGLTPQLEERFRARFGPIVGGYHSGLREAARRDNWLLAAAGQSRVLIGTRSAVFVPMPDLSLIVIDEEHDASFKQQEGFRYSARDVAIRRAQKAGIPVILGSATPSLESLSNASLGRYHSVRLNARVHSPAPPQPRLIDCRGQTLQDGLTPALLDACRRHLDMGGQILLFINRRGYAPALLCHDCGWVASCPHCDARMTLHRSRRRLSCHHCASETSVPLRCAQCSGTALIPVGQGTERLEQAMREHFPEVRTECFDSDRMAKAGEWQRLLADVRSGAIRILVGTQMLAKGHDFSGLSLVGVADADHALFSADFRAVERLGQLLTQVSGRAGRGTAQGEVLIQTHQPDHPHLQQWLRGGYPALASALLDERRQTALPPFRYLALIRADAIEPGAALDFLRTISRSIPADDLDVMGPSPAPMERRANRHRAQLLLRSSSRARLQAVLASLIPRLDSNPGNRRLRWSVDVDPVDLY
ncbi:MAG: replication restart helicase PriA [Panacagrimonas sp.]